ncbi:fused MFS/spermidine synthase [Candidatus Hydrogenedentota bacterium]
MPPDPWPFKDRFFPSATVFISSACIMIIELVAGRLISRYVGQSLYTWTAIIGMVLAGISIGNYVGGRLADKYDSSKLLAILFFTGAVGCPVLLVLNDTVGNMQLLWTMSWPARIFTHVALVFLIPSTVLGTISPTVAKYALSQGHATGRTVGGIYAWGTVGSIAGTFVTGFFLIALMGATSIIWTVSVMLMVLGGAYLAQTFVARNAVTVNDVPKPFPVQENKRGDKPSPMDWLIPNGTVFVAGACVMTIELVAGRMLCRAVGQSLYTWTSVIGIILAGMSIGNYLGGTIADRFDVKKSLPILFALSAASVLAIPPVAEQLRESFFIQAMGRLPRTLIYVTVAFLAPSVIIGTITPVVAKMALTKGRNVGRTVGNVYAWGAGGSIIGTFLAGFWLLSRAGTTGTLCITAGVLILLGIMYAHHSKICYALSLVCLVCIFAAVAPGQHAVTLGWLLSLRELPSRLIVFEDETQYSYINITTEMERPHTRMMYLDRLLHSMTDLRYPTKLLYRYEWIYTAVLDRHYPPGDGESFSALVIGGGGYTYPRYLEITRPGSHIEVAEIDPAVTRSAHIAFGFPEDTRIRVFDLDARNHVSDIMRRRRAGEDVPKFDCVFGDSINDYSVPYHLTTKEFTQDIHDLLTEDGIYMLNLIDAPGSGRFVGAVANTCRQIFPNLFVFSTQTSSMMSNKRDTFVVICSKRTIDIDAVWKSLIEKHPKYTGHLLNSEDLELLKVRSRNLVLTDDFAPVDNLLTSVVRTSTLPREVLLLTEARKLHAAGKVDAAIDMYAEMLKENPDSGVAMFSIGACLAEKHDLDGALDALRKAERMDFGDGIEIVYYNLGRVLVKKGDLDSAINELLRSLELDPKYDAAHYALGSVYLMKEMNEEAVSALQKAVKLKPEYAEAYGNLAIALWRTDKLQEARTAVENCRRHGGTPQQALVAALKDGVRK